MTQELEESLKKKIRSLNKSLKKAREQKKALKQAKWDAERKRIRELYPVDEESEGCSVRGRTRFQPGQTNWRAIYASSSHEEPLFTLSKNSWVIRSSDSSLEEKEALNKEENHD